MTARKRKVLAVASLLQRNHSRSFGIAHPLRASAWSDQVARAITLKQIDRSGVEFAALASTDLQEVVVGEAESEADQPSENAIEDFLNGGRGAEFWC